MNPPPDHNAGHLHSTSAALSESTLPTPQRDWSNMTRTIAHYERIEQIGEGIIIKNVGNHLCRTQAAAAILIDNAHVLDSGCSHNVPQTYQTPVPADAGCMYTVEEL